MRKAVPFRMSLAHAWGGLSDDPSRTEDNVNLLVDTTRTVDR